ncbi:hypothetical protein [Pseudoduganella lutea]|uniref:Uncharacterized protein n=1 Tax=Pseudoduganella lutea TaxID=321985 RepID=A0A4P6L0F9_9BURK|nr:hypothetical protein [Pseudoduganella lutea]QBE64926.1 hypothetical protein EWM63_19615 [Pseudoduganella lutea]
MPKYEKATHENLFNIGLQWKDNMCREGNRLFLTDEKKKEIDKALMEICGYTVYTVFHKNDPFVKVHGGKGVPYTTIMATAGAKTDKGASEANDYLLWITNQKKFVDLSLNMQNLAVITHVAEVGRGYTIDALKNLVYFLNKVGQGKDKWSNLKNTYHAALTYKEDQADYVPSSDDDTDMD